MKRLICMVLVCAGCGPAFTYASVDEELIDDGGEVIDAAPTADSEPVADGGHHEAATLDAAVDAGVLDAALIDATPPQDSATIDSAPTCTPFVPGDEGSCFSGGSTSLYPIPTDVCSTWAGSRSTPAACSDCAEHYTCACLTASVTCAGNPVSCTLVNGNPTLSCQ